MKSVRESLSRMLETGNLPQALLFAGPKGTGKTSTARIIAALVNDPANAEAIDTLFFSSSSKKVSLEEPTESEQTTAITRGASFAVHELDAASNRGIDDIRQLKEEIQLPPQQGKMSVYILDEAHMLTTEAFNALLKVLEEPPSHVIFILATTELHKIPETIVSRCTLVPFQLASDQEIYSALAGVLQAENIEFEEAALNILVDQAAGSFRDAVKMLEQVVVGKKKLTSADVEQSIATINEDVLVTLLSSVIAKDDHAVVDSIQSLRSTGASESVVYKQLLAFLHKQLIAHISGDPQASFADAKICHFFLDQLQDLKLGGSIVHLALELKLLELIFRSRDKSGSGVAKQHRASSKASGKSSDAVKAQSVATPTMSTDEPSSVLMTKSVESTEAVSIQSDNLIQPDTLDATKLLEGWQQFVRAVEQKNSTIGALLRSSSPNPQKSNGTAVVDVYYAFHKEQLELPKCKNLLDECAISILGGKPVLEFVLESPPATPVSSSQLEETSEKVVISALT